MWNDLLHFGDTVQNYHDDVVTWKLFLHYWPFVRGIHQSLLALCEGNPPVTDRFPSQRATDVEPTGDVE